MELVLKNKQVSKVYKDGSIESEQITGETYDIKDGETVIGNASIHTSGFSLNVNNGKSIDESRDFIESIL